jgi:REP element-mobilizing transposase RayT
MTPQEPDLHISRRRLPHWQLDGATYFLTFRLLTGELDPPRRKIVLNHIQSGHGRFYTLIAVVVMPDHVHVLLRPLDGVDLSRITKGMKGASARLLNKLDNTTGSIWQDESWDRVIRDQVELDEKLLYMLNNPLKRGLVQDPWDYDGWSYNGDPS